MKRLSVTLFLLLLLASGTLAQQTIPAAKPTPADDRDVVRISTNLIQVDVTVTDKKGVPVRDLRAEEIEIYENGKLQKISNFSFIPGVNERDKTRQASGNGEKKSPEPVLPGRPLRPDQVRRTMALVVDDLHLSFASMTWVREALKKFVKEQMQDGDLVAIIRTGAGMGALQQFTFDKRQLLAAIDRVKYNPSGASGFSFFNNVSQSATNDIITAPGAADAPAEAVFDITGDASASNEQMATRFEQFRENIFASGTLGALNFIIRGMKELPGRKSVVLLSDGLPAVIREDGAQPGASALYSALKRLIDLANRSSVVFYPVHATGLQAPMLGEAADDISGVSRMGGERVTSDLFNARLKQISASQEGLRYLAEETGGLAYINQNDISTGIRRALNDQSYYLVSYEPDEDLFNSNASRFNTFEVKVKRPDVQVRYRSGFFGISEEQIKKPVLTPVGAIVNALTSPFAINDIDMRMNAIFVQDGKDAALVKSFIRVDGHDLTFKDAPDARHICTFDLVAFTFGDSGNVIDQRSKTITLNLSRSEYQAFLERGLSSTFELYVRKAGAYQVRVAIRDAANGRVGSANQFIEVPDVKKKRLLLSGVVIESLPLETWRNVNAAAPSETTDPIRQQRDTALRQFKAGSVLRYGFQIYNAADKPGLTYRLRLYAQSRSVYESRPTPMKKVSMESRGVLATTGALFLGGDLSAGDYILQIDVSNNPASGRGETASQFIQFEVVE